ncbi:MAG TPA: hypothetical protein VN222_13605 [Novosphingobium sp.]|nr:hypothetical protein [Novosphingobium sp.]
MNAPLPPTDATLNAINVDGLGRMVMALAQEVWVIRDRLVITEKLLEEKAGITAADIDDYVADEATKAHIEALRDRFAAKVIGAPVAGHDRSVDAIIERAGLPPRPKAG